MNPLENYGLAGIVIAGLAWFIMYLMRQHKSERKELTDTIAKQTDESNRNIKENTSILSALKTLLESRK